MERGMERETEGEGEEWKTWCDLKESTPLTNHNNQAELLSPSFLLSHAHSPVKVEDGRPFCFLA